MVLHSKWPEDGALGRLLGALPRLGGAACTSYVGEAFHFQWKGGPDFSAVGWMECVHSGQ